MSATCHRCKRVLRVGEVAFASNWTVITNGSTRTEVRYECEQCVSEVER